MRSHYAIYASSQRTGALGLRLIVFASFALVLDPVGIHYPSDLTPCTV